MDNEMKPVVAEPVVGKFRGPRPPVRTVVGDDVVRIESVSGDPSGSIIMPRDVYDRLTDPDGPSPSPNMPSESTTHQYLGTKSYRHEADPEKRAAAKRARAARRRNR